MLTKNTYSSLSLYLYRFFGEFCPILPYSAIYFLDLDISISQISLLFLAWSLTIIIFEIPTGILADHYDRKTILILSRILKGTVFAMWLFIPNFWGILGGFILWGISTALDSGAFQAFLYDKLDAAGKTDSFSKIYGTASSWGFMGLLLSALLGSALVGKGFDLLLVVSGISLAVSTLTLLLLVRKTETKELAADEEQITFFKTFKKNFYLVLTHSWLLPLVVIGIAAGGIKGSLEEYHPLLLELKEIDIAVIGLIIAVFEIAKTAGSYLAGYMGLEEKKTKIYTQGILLAIIGISLAVSGFGNGYAVIVALFLVAFIDSILWIVNDAAIQHTVTEYRATVASLKNFGVEIVALLSFFGAYISTQYVSVTILYQVGGVILLLVGLFYIVKGKFSSKYSF